MAGAVVLAVGAVFAVGVLGLTAKPTGFTAPPADGPSVAMPPLVAPLDEAEATDAAPVAPLEDVGAISGSSAAPPSLIDPDWTSQISDATGIPTRALAAYAAAHVALSEEQPGCGIDWTTLAAIGEVESDHGSHGGTVLGDDGYPQQRIVGPPLDGNGVAAIEDTDGGAFDGDQTWDRAVGPMQFIPTTWAKWGSDANGDGVADPNQIDDAAHGAARYLCASGTMTTAEGWRAAVFSYNHLDSYVDKVASIAIRYATATAGGN